MKPLWPFALAALLAASVAEAPAQPVARPPLAGPGSARQAEPLMPTDRPRHDVDPLPPVAGPDHTPRAGPALPEEKPAAHRMAPDAGEDALPSLAGPDAVPREGPLVPEEKPSQDETGPPSLAGPDAVPREGPLLPVGKPADGGADEPPPLAGPGDARREGPLVPQQKPGPPETADSEDDPQETGAADAPPPIRPTPEGCLADLEAAGAVFESRPAIREGDCGVEAPVAVSAVGGIRIDEVAVLRCDAALALARWAADVVGPSAVLHLDSEVTAIAVGSSYICRGRRTGGGSGGKLSEHAMANAVDVSAVVLADGRRIPVLARPESADPARAFQAAIRGGACALFTTVLGPGTNAAHADHLHLDRAYRRGGYRLCQ